MGVFSIFSKKKKAVGSPAVGGSTRHPGPARPLSAAGSTSKPGRASWVITTASGSKAMSPVTPKVVPARPSAPGATTVSKVSRGSFSAAKGKIPSYTKVPSFAKNYPRVPARTFVRDLSDTNLTRTFGGATTGTPKAIQTAKIAAKAKDPFEGLPAVNLPTIGKTTTANKPTPAAQPSVKPVEIKQAAAKIQAAGTPTFAQITGAGIKKALPYAGGIAAGAIGLGAVAIAGKEPRRGERRVQSIIPGGAETDRRSRIERRDTEHGQTGNKFMRGKVLAGEKFSKEETDKAFSSAAGTEGAKREAARQSTSALTSTEQTETQAMYKARSAEMERRKVNVGGTRRAEDVKVPATTKPRIKIKATTTEVPAVSTPGKVISQKKLIAPKVTAPAAIVAAPTAPVKKPRKLKGTGTAANKAAIAQAIPKTEVVTPKKEVGYYDKGGEFDRIKALEKQKAGVPVADLQKSGFTEKRKAVRREEVLPQTEPGYGRRAGTFGGRRVGDVGKPDLPMTEQMKKVTELNTASGVIGAKSPISPPVATSEKPKKGYRFRHPKKEVAGASTTSSEELNKLLTREGPSTSVTGVETITQEPAIDKVRRKIRRDRAMAKAESTVGSSQSLTASMNQQVNADRAKAIAEHIKKKGVTKLPVATEEMMMPERFAPPQEMAHPGKLISTKKLGTGKPPEVKLPAQAQPISSNEELLAKIAKAREENARLKGAQGQTTISTEGKIKATAPPRVTIRKNIKPPVTTPSPIAPAETVKAVEATGPKVIYKGKIKPRLGKLGVAALVGAGASAAMAGKEAQASTGSLMAGAKAAGKSLYESGRELAKFSMGAAIAARLPGVAGTVARTGLAGAGALGAGVGAGVGAYNIYKAGQAGMGAFRAKAEAEKERKGSEAKYGTVALATATRKKRQGLM